MTLLYFAIGLICTTAFIMYLVGRPTRKFLVAQREELRAEVRRLEGLLTAKSLQDARILVELEAANKRLEGEKNNLKMQHAFFLMQPDRLTGHHLKIHELAAEHLTAEMPHFAQAWQRALRHAGEIVSQEAEGRTQPFLLLKNLGGKIRSVLRSRQKSPLIMELQTASES